MDLQGHNAFLLSVSKVFLCFLFPFGSVVFFVFFFLLVLLNGRQREEPQRLSAKGMSSAG